MSIVGSEDSIISNLIEQVKGLFGGTKQQSLPHTTTNIPAGNIYQSPIHGDWHSSGGFDLTSRRPNGRVGHQGVDMRTAAGTPIYSLTSGVVSGVGVDPVGGNVINIQHPDNVRTYYAHLSTVKVQKGDKVDANTIIGTVGSTGNARGTFPHLHFQVWKDGQITDPAKFFSVPKYTDLSAKEKQQGPWLSPQAKQDAESFNMKEHLAKKRTAFSQDSDQLLKLSFEFQRLTKKI